ncbi:MAG: phosphatidate cytidylyltransferase, partial [Luteibaculum sp.]
SAILSPVQGIIFGVWISLMATMGDLFESALKRYAGVKDSGAIMPGHGGILDRIDSILFVIPGVYGFLILL